MQFRALFPRRWHVSCLLAAAVLLLSSRAVLSKEVTVVRVEEDWELSVLEPDTDSGSPQVTCVISPMPGTDGVHAVFTINHESLPKYVPGGLQLQVWDGNVPLLDRRHPSGHIMETANETVRWTQAMELKSGTLTFEVVDGDSAAWGSFGGRGYLKASLDTSLSHLGDYHPSVSVDNSGVGYAGNRVQRLELMRVRYYTASGDEWEVSVGQTSHVRE